MTDENRWDWNGEALPASYRSLLYVQAAISLLFLTAVLAAAWMFIGAANWPLPFDPIPPLTVIFTIALLRSIIAPWRYHASWRFQTAGDELRLRRGVLTKVETLVPFSRVQHIDVERGPLERLFGLSSLVLHTAGTRGASVTLPGLYPARAEQLRSEIRADLALDEIDADAR